jgi:hypothetical protein
MASEGTRYRVSYMEPVRKFLKECSKQAVSKGLAAKLLETLTALDEHLRKEPRQFGDVWNHFGKLDLYHRLFPPLDVVYAVHHTEPLVFVRRIRPFPSHYFN